MKLFLTAVLCLYLGAGMFGALLLKQGIPALNGFGMAYITLTWPKMIYCAPVERECNAIPSLSVGKHMFSF